VAVQQVSGVATLVTPAESIDSEFARFRDRRAALAEIPDRETWKARVTASAMLGLGVLLGGGFPDAAAAISFLLQSEFPDERWPWSTPL